MPSEKIRKELGVILYEANVLGTKGPRKMKVLLPALDMDGRRALFKPMNDVNYLSYHFRKKESMPHIRTENGNYL